VGETRFWKKDLGGKIAAGGNYEDNPNPGRGGGREGEGGWGEKNQRETARLRNEKKVRMCQEKRRELSEYKSSGKKKDFPQEGN